MRKQMSPGPDAAQVAQPPGPSRASAKLVASRRMRARLARCGAILLGLVLMPVLLFRAAVAWWAYPPGLLRAPQSSRLVLDRDGVPLAAFASDDGQWHFPLTKSQISPRLLHAITAVEDARFRTHHGVDWRSVLGAAWQDARRLRVSRGASTITMQLHRLREPRPRTWVGKIEQLVRAEQIEQRESKEQILVEYVNRAPFGGNLVGAGAASWRYFGKPCRDLSLGEAALLAGLPQSPNRLRPDVLPAKAKARRDHVLDRMLACGFVTREQRDEAAAEPVNASWHALPQDRPAGDLPPADGALPTLLWLAQQAPAGTLSTSIDRVTQRQVALAAREQLGALQSSGVSAVAVVVLDTPTSRCLASVSLGGEHNSIDLTRSPRSTGSVLKPFIYAAAFDCGSLTPDSILNDSPASWPGYEPNDYDRTFRGPMKASEALAQSRNIPAMLVLAKVGVPPAVGIMDAAGLHGLARSPGRYGLSLAIGGAEATPLEVAQAYAALGRGGIARPAAFAGRMDGNPSSRFLRPGPCWQALGAIGAADRTAEICPEAAASHVAWKTGTSSAHRDAWCAAATRRRTVVVWMGNADAQSSPALVGQDAAAPLALRIVAMLDPHDAPWPLVRSKPETESPPLDSPALVLVSPAPGEQIVLTPDDSAQRQRVRLRASHRGGGDSEAQKLWWFVDDSPLAAAPESQRLWWSPTPGPHEIRVVDSLGHSAQAAVHVARPGRH